LATAPLLEMSASLLMTSPHSRCTSRDPGLFLGGHGAGAGTGLGTGWGTGSGSPVRVRPTEATRPWTCILRLLILLLIPAIFVSPAAAQFGTPGLGQRQPTGESLVAVDLVADSRSIAAGETIELAFAFRIEPRWHIYWVNAGASGVATEIRTRAPEGFEIGAIRWPTPRSFSGEEGITYGYEGQVALFLPVTAPDELPDGPVELRFDIDWLVCRVVCLTGSARRTIQLNASSDETVEDGAMLTDDAPSLVRRAIERSRSTIPEPLKNLEGASVRIRDGEVVVEGPLGDAEPDSERPIRFFPIDSPGVTSPSTATVSVEDGNFRVASPILIRPENSLGRPLTIGGVVALPDGRSFEFLIDTAASARSAAQ